MENYLGKQISDAYKPDPTFDKLANSSLKNTNAEQQNALNQKNSYVIELEQQVSKLRKQLSESQQNATMYMAKFKKSEQMVNSYKHAYTENRFILAQWMLSQKAFKAAAIEFGATLGKTADEVIEIGNTKKMDVLDNKFHPEHGCNANAMPLLEESKEKLMETILTKKKMKP
jgi:hypothetical protein